MNRPQRPDSDSSDPPGSTTAASGGAASAIPASPDSPRSLLLIAAQPLLRLGLRIALEKWATIVLELEHPEQALGANLDLALVLVQWSNDPAEDQLRALDRLVRIAPARPILVIADLPPRLVDELRRTGVRGCCPLDTPPDTLQAIVERVALGDQFWAESQPRGPWLVKLQRSGLTEIDAQLGLLQQQWTQSSRWDRLWIEGQCRELRAARWLLCLPNAIATGQAPKDQQNGQPAAQPDPQALAQPARETGNSALSRSGSGSVSGAIGVTRSAWDLLNNRTASLITPSLLNLSGTPLEIDALTPQRRRELLGLVLRQVGTQLEMLRQSRWSEADPDRLHSLLLTCWQESLTEFYGRYANLPTPDGPVALVPLLLAGEPIVAELLTSIYGVDALVDLVLDQQPMPIDGVLYTASSIDTLARAELYLHNLVIQLANAVVYPLLNSFPEHPLIRQSFWAPSLFSTRDIERFRNSLSWYHRVTQFFELPRDIYESRHRLLSLQPGAIQVQAIYAPRRDELSSLPALQQGLALAIEIQDAVSPHLQRLIRWLGGWVVYVLTQIIGRGLGLVGRGILQGIGQSFGDRSLEQTGGKLGGRSVRE